MDLKRKINALDLGRPAADRNIKEILDELRERLERLEREVLPQDPDPDIGLP